MALMRLEVEASPVLGSRALWPPAGQEASVASLATLMRLESPARLLNPPPRQQAAPSQTVGFGLQARGMEHAESRPYQAGDDARTIDWKVTARQHRAYTKLYRREREHPMWVVIDLRASMFFATRTALKSVFAVHTAALLVWAVQHVGDLTGCLCLTESGWRVQAPKRGRAAIEASLRMLATLAMPAAASNSGLATPRAPCPRPRGDAVYLISDFRHADAGLLLSPWADGSQKPPRLAVAHIFDPIEAELPPFRNATVLDASGARWGLDTSPTARRQHRQQFEDRCQQVQSQVLPMGAAYSRFATNSSPLEAARRLLSLRSDPKPRP